MTPGLPLHELRHEPSSKVLHVQAEDLTVPPTAQRARRWLWGRNDGALCPSSCHPGLMILTVEMASTWRQTRRAPMPWWSGAGWLHPSGSGVLLGAPARQHPLEWAGPGQVADHSLSHQHLNESFVFVLCFPVSEKCTPPGGQVVGPRLMPGTRSSRQPVAAYLQLRDALMDTAVSHRALGLEGGFSLELVRPSLCSHPSTTPLSISANPPVVFQVSFRKTSALPMAAITTWT